MQEIGDKSRLSFKVKKYSTSGRETSSDYVTVEEPLEIRSVDSNKKARTLAVIMRTPGMDDLLSLGFLFTEGIVRKMSDVLSVKTGPELNVVEIQVSDSAVLPNDERSRNFFVNSSCGVCGKGNINDIFVKSGKLIRSRTQIRPEIIRSLPEKMGKMQPVFSETGGIHAAGLFRSDGSPVFVAEDIGRHNAVDKVVGYMLKNDLTFDENLVLQVSGRAGFEIVQKAAIAGIPIVCSVSAPSSLAIQTAEAMNMTLVCFVRGKRFNVYSGQERIAPE